MNILDTMMYSYSDEVEEAYVITVYGNKISQDYAQRCGNSCQQIGQSYMMWPAFDGTDGKTVQTPDHLKKQSWLNMIKFTSYKMTVSEIACAMSHISLWVRCMEVDRPIVILEHDAVLCQPYKRHAFRNSICWLGNQDALTQYENGAFPLKTPPMPGETKNTVHINTCQAYAIDPMVANQMFISVLDRGLYAPVDIMLKNSKFCIVQTGLYNLSKNDKSTIDRHNGLFEHYGVDVRQ